ncbi:MAG: 2-oxoacid:acceptor oxidoreductase family protein [Bacillota bacterium]|nr:2-oxoacid:acceptor oxidoreductase family protein [Bacillota bacterium]
MGELLEIRWHGRGGQGAKTAAQLLGESAAAAGKYIQAFPEYGPERMGAPVLAFNRISEEPITIHCHVKHPRYVVVLDDTFVGKVDFTDGVPPNGALIINTALSPAEMRRRLQLEGNPIRVWTVDATKIALETIGRAIPNTPMMGALVRATGILKLEDLIEDTRRKLEKKFRHKQEVIAGNLEAIRRAYEEVQEG